MTKKEEIIQLYRQAVSSGLPLDIVHEKVATAAEKSAIAERMEAARRQQLLTELKQQTPWSVRLAAGILPPVFIVLGIFLAGSALVPIASSFLTTSPSLKNAARLLPGGASQSLEVMPQVVSQVQADGSSPDSQPEPSPTSAEELVMAPTIDNTQLDYTNLSNWFPSLQLPSTSNTQQMSEYRIDIPDVDIQNAVVKVGGSNLDKSLIQYPGTANPGNPGTPVIFGHSVLRQFYNPSEKNPRRYSSIFSKIMTLGKGQLIYITQDNVRYTYRVRDKTVVQPEDTYILDQDYAQKSLKIVTCVPEGTVLQRGVVTADLVKTE